MGKSALRIYLKVQTRTLLQYFEENGLRKLNVKQTICLNYNILQMKGEKTKISQ